MDGQARHHRPPQRTDEHLRGPHRFVAPGTGLPWSGQGAGPLRQGGRLHPRGVPAGGRAPLRRLLGLPGHQLLRTHLALRHPGRLPLPGGPAPPGRHRRHPGLGARPLPQGRVGPGPLRRHPAVRGPRPSARRAPRLGHLRVQLRTQRGAQLPRRQRPLLAPGVPRRRSARRRRGLHALPGLLAPGRPVAPQPVRWPRAPGGHQLPARGHRHRLPQEPRHHHGRRGVHGVAGRHRPHRVRRPGLRTEVEHGLDERHPALPRGGPGQPPLPPRRADLLPRLRLLRAVHPAAEPR